MSLSKRIVFALLSAFALGVVAGCPSTGADEDDAEMHEGDEMHDDEMHDGDEMHDDDVHDGDEMHDDTHDGDESHG